MSSRAEHYREAERLIADSHDQSCVWEPGARERMLKEAEIRATLANTSDDAYNEYLDLLSMESLREEVAKQPGPESRGWLMGDEHE